MSKRESKANTDGKLLNSALAKLARLKTEVSQEVEIYPNSSFYYDLHLPSVEKSYELVKVMKVTEKSELSRKLKKAKKMEVKLKTARDKLENLTITVKNDAMTVKKKDLKEDDRNALLEKLKMLQNGKITSENLSKKAPKKSKENKSKENKSDEIERNKQEINELNMRVREKINEIKPKIRRLFGGQLNGLRRYSETSVTHVNDRNEPKMTKIRRPTRKIPISKTLVKVSETESREIHRYSFDDLYQLQYFTTWELVPRLVELSICRTPLLDIDKFIIKLLGVKDDDENVKKSNLFSEILKEAERKRYVKILENNRYEFCRVMKEEHPKPLQDEPNSLTKAPTTSEPMKVYRYEFISMFGGSLHKTNEENVKDFVDSGKAYVIEGEIRVNSKNCQEAYVSHPKGEKDICLPSLLLRKFAFNGDFVKVLVKQEAQRPTVDDSEEASRNFGIVLDIIEKRHSRRVIASISGTTNMKKRYLIFVPRDSKIPTIKIHRDNIPKNIEISEKTLFVVEITDFTTEHPIGKIVNLIGNKGDLGVENTAILLQNNLDPQPYSPHIVEQFSPNYDIPESEFAYREDLRRKCIFSIDPESARDLDDALSCDDLPNGNVEIGVHISDVSFFLKENSELDLIVKEKATSIYMVDQVYHMLPLPLCLSCSLLPGDDKIAYSVFWEMNPETAEILSTRFTRSVVHSCGKLSYDHAQSIIEGKDCKFPEIYNNFTIEDVKKVILKLQKIAVILRNKRKENGALKIDQPKIAFKFNDDKFTAPADFFKYEIKDSNRLIEEFMLLANISVAKFINEKFPSISLLRSHPPPNEGALKKLVKTLEKQGIALDTSSSAAISRSMEELARNNPSMNAALNMMVSKTMNRAKYFCSDTAEQESDFWHYALSIDKYTHFTSPIRRYADVLVHRVLSAALNYESTPTRTPDEVQQLATICNVQKYNAKHAGDESCELYFKSFIKSLKSKAMQAAVVGIYEFNLEVVLLETGTAIKVYYKNLQQFDDVIIKPFNEDSPPYVTVVLPKAQKTSKIVFGSLLLVQVEVFKEKLIVNRIFYNDL